MDAVTTLIKIILACSGNCCINSVLVCSVLLSKSTWVSRAAMFKLQMKRDPINKFTAIFATFGKERIGNIITEI